MRYFVFIYPPDADRGVPAGRLEFLEHFVIENIYSEEMLRRWRRRACPPLSDNLKRKML
jgi:hypothetical protein